MEEVIPQLWRIPSNTQGPTVTVLGGVHGNERVGIEVINALFQSKIEQQLTSGTVFLGFGNPAAIAQKKRFVETDLNRSFAKREASSLEDRRAADMKPILEKTDILLDVHATIKDAEPFTLTPNDLRVQTVRRIVSILGMQKIITGKCLYDEEDNPVSTCAFVHSLGKQAYTLEAGQLDDVSRVGSIILSIRRVLQYCGMLEDTSLNAVKMPDSFDVWEAYWSVRATNDFSFLKEWKNFELVKAHQVFALRDGKSLRPYEDSVMIFPKSPQNIVVGQEACLLARRPKDPLHV